MVDTTENQATEITVTINEEEYTRTVPNRTLLIHFLRDELNLKGSKIGCETSVCGCCTVLLNGDCVKSCTMFALQADGQEVTTIEGLANEPELEPIQRSFSENNALQCGYCTAGMIMSAYDFCEKASNPSREEITKDISGNLCRCTGYKPIIDAIEEVATEDAD